MVLLRGVLRTAVPYLVVAAVFTSFGRPDRAGVFGPASVKAGEPSPESKASTRGRPDSTPLEEAVSAFNQRAAAYLRPWIERGDLSAEQLPTALTAEQVVSAIRNWEPSTEAAKRAHPIYERIAATKMLPQRADLTFRLQWYPYDEHGRTDDEYEHWLWIINLDVFTSETTGYGHLVGRQSLVRRALLGTSPGYTWIINPRDLKPAPGTPTRPSGMSTGEIHTVIDEASDGSLLVTASWLEAAGGREGVDLRAVAFDAHGTRYLLDRHSLGSHSPLIGGLHRMARFRLDPALLPLSKARHLGFEALTADGLRIAAQAALRRAREQGIEVLPWPELDQPYAFALTAADGKRIESKELRGKVVLIDCWASWCGPCMAHVPLLKELYRKWHPEGLEIVGVSFDSSVQDAKAAYAAHEIPWSLVVVPDDDEVRQLWDEAARVPPIPRYLLIDRSGIVRADLSSPKIAEELQEKIKMLIDSRSDEGSSDQAR